MHTHSLPAAGVMYIWNESLGFRVLAYQHTRGDIEVNKEKQPLRVKVYFKSVLHWGVCGVVLIPR